jgi:hypothetical protein
MRRDGVSNLTRPLILCIATLVVSAFTALTLGQSRVLDDFESPEGWKIITAEGVTLSVHEDEGVKGRALRLDYEFVTGAGYCIIQKPFAITFPDNYEFAFQLRGQGPPNNLEFKLLDASGDNVWWHNRRALEWPRDWKRIVDKKRTIEFAWGPSGGAPMKEIAKIEFAISSSSGGKGSVWLDELTFRELPPVSHEPLKATATASSQSDAAAPANVLDGDPSTAWRSAPAKVGAHPTLTLDLSRVAEFGGLEIDWDESAQPAAVTLDSSDDRTTWTVIQPTRPVRAPSTIIPTPDAEARYIRLTLTPASPGAPVGIRELRLEGPEFSASPNAFFADLAAEAPRGRYPRAFLNEQSYWTVIGVDGDDAEALINEEGAVELRKRGPTLEPFLQVDDKLLTWADGEHSQTLETGYLPIPTVVRRHAKEQLELTITAFADGEAGSSQLWVTYRIRNLSQSQQAPAKRGTLHIALRPMQVNPPWQKLNNEGGFAPLTSVTPGNEQAAGLLFPGCFVQSIASHGTAAAATFESGDIVTWLSAGKAPLSDSVEDPEGRASGEIAFAFELAPGESRQFTLRAPMHQGFADAQLAAESPSMVERRRAAAASGWEKKVSRATITVPKQDQWIADTFKSQLAYILINRDGPAIQPGSRSYERSWARDGSMTSAALLACGHAEEVREWIDWFGSHQFESGKIPCVVDSRGPDPVPEHDSNGEYIWAVANYYRCTHDGAFLNRHWPRVQRAVAYIQSLRAQRMSDEYAAPGPKHSLYGLVPESISHEGYSAKPMHSYWDDFFVLLGLKEAAWLAERVARDSIGGPDSQGRAPDAQRLTADYAALVPDFRKCLYDSMQAAMTAKGIDFIPGCVELGDFDSTSTTIALSPCDELDNAPEPALRRTFDRYWDSFESRRSPLAAWDAFTPYELRHVGAFVRLGQPQRAYEALSWFHQFQRPQGWNHWAEVVWHDPLTPKFIGDMPHTWVGSDFLNSVLSMFLYEHADRLIVFAGVPREWVASGEEVGFSDIRTTRGTLSGSLRLGGGKVLVKLWSTGPWTEGDIIVRTPAGAKGPDAQARNLPAQFTFEYAP